MALAVPIFLSGAWCETFPQHLPNHEIPSAALRGKTKGAEVEVVEKYDGGAKLKITLHEGRNREIRKMCEQVDLKVGRLCRVQIGEIKLGGLALGKWRHLDRSQVKYLKNIKSKAK